MIREIYKHPPERGRENLLHPCDNAAPTLGENTKATQPIIDDIN